MHRVRVRVKPATAASLFLFSVIAIGPVHARAARTPPFSVNALEYLLERSDYEKFDWYIQRYIDHYPDTAVLHLLQGYRYFQQAAGSALRSARAPEDRTGGIPRRYPECLLVQAPQRLLYTVEYYDEALLRRAFSAMHRALQCEPDRRDIWVGMCHMAAQAGRPAMLMEKVTFGCGRFACDSQIVNIATSLSRRYHTAPGDSSMIPVLRHLLTRAPAGMVHAELARHFLALDRTDSAAAHLRRALAADSANTDAMATAVALAAFRGEFREAARVSELRYEVTRRLADLEQAVIFASAMDTARARSLTGRALDAGLEPDSSLLVQFKAHLQMHLSQTPTFFEGEHLPLNYPLVEVALQYSHDTLTYYQHKAGLCYASAHYDSAAWYNLRLLRAQVRKEGLDYATVFNLAAEYYASGEYLMSYVRFMDLYKHGGGRRDVGVRYGLAVNCDSYGDDGLAAFHYRYVSNRHRTNYERYWPLRTQADKRLAALGNVRPRFGELLVGP